jgi:hypothetical protein
MLDLWSQGGSEVLGPVAGAVVAHHCGDDDADVGEVGSGASPERGGGLLLLVVEDFGVGQPGVVVDGVMQEGVAP